MQNYNFIIFFILLAWQALASIDDIKYHKNSLVGGRAATMGGAYKAISDDAAGAYYNPAGIALAPSNSISGSAKVFQNSSLTYKEALGSEDYQRDSKNFLPSFFGYLSKNGNSTHSISYILHNVNIEHQDQVYSNVGSADTLLFNFHRDDQTHLFGYSYGYKVSDNFSWGLSLNYHYRILRRNLHNEIEFNDGEDAYYFENVSLEENGIRPKLGIIFNLTDKLAVGLTYATTIISSSEYKTQTSSLCKPSASDCSDTPTSRSAEVQTSTSTEARKTPQEIGIGFAYFASPRFLMALDFDYYLEAEEGKQDVLNISAGMEYYFSGKWAARMGLYTNNTNDPQPTNSTEGVEYVNMLGITVGMSYFANSTSINFGVVTANGTGKAQPYYDTKDTVDLTRSTTSVILSSAYGF